MSDVRARRWRLMLILGIVLVALGSFIALTSQPVAVRDIGFVPGQEVSPFPARLVGGVMLGAGVALAAAVCGYVLGRRR